METPLGLDDLWQALIEGLDPENERMLRRLIKAHTLLLVEMVRLAEKSVQE